jgi:hypothetical protein
MRDYGHRILWKVADLKLVSELEYLKLRAAQLVIPGSNPDKGRDFVFSFTLRPSPSPFGLVPNGYMELFFAWSKTVWSFTSIHSRGLRIRGAIPPLPRT